MKFLLEVLPLALVGRIGLRYLEDHRQTSSENGCARNRLKEMIVGLIA